MTDTLTARAARWCEAAGIPKPDDVEQMEKGVAMTWCVDDDEDFPTYIFAGCRMDGSLRWSAESGGASWDRGSDSASLIAAIKETMA